MRTARSTASSGIAATVPSASTTSASSAARDSGTTRLTAVPAPRCVRTATVPPIPSIASRTTSRPIPRPAISPTRAAVLMPPRSSSAISSSALAVAAAAPSPRPAAARRTASRSTPPPSSLHEKTISGPRRDTDTAICPAALLPAARRSAGGSMPCATALRTICTSAACTAPSTAASSRISPPLGGVAELAQFAAEPVDRGAEPRVAARLRRPAQAVEPALDLADAVAQRVDFGELGAQRADRGLRPGRCRLRLVERRHLPGDVAEMVQYGAEAFARHRAGAVAVALKRLLDGVRALGNPGQLDHPGGAFQRMRQTQQPRHRRAVAAFERQHAVAELIEQFARLQAEIPVGVSRHAPTPRHAGG